MSVPNWIKEYRITDYDSRRTWDSGLDAGSTPARSIWTSRGMRKRILYVNKMKSSLTALFVLWIGLLLDKF